MSALGTPRMLAHHLRSGFTGSLLVGLLVAVAVLGAALAPRALAAVGTEELRFQLRTTSPLLVDLSGSGRVGLAETSPTGDIERLFGGTVDSVANLRDRLFTPLADAALTPQWVTRTLADDAELTGPQRLRFLVDLTVDLRLTERIRVIDGELPSAWRPDLDGDAPLDIAVSAATAEAAGVAIGDVLEYGLGPLRVAAIYEAVDPDDPYWIHQSISLNPILYREAGSLPTVRSSVYVAPASAIPLQSALANGEFDAWIPIDPDAIAYEDLTTVATQVRNLTTSTAYLPDGGSLDFRSGLANALERVLERVTAVSALLALSLSGLVGVVIAVVALGIRSVLARRAPALSLLAARGASALQLRALMALEGALVTLPPSALAFGLASLLLPGEPEVAGWLGPLLLALTPIVLFAALTSPAGLRPPRNDLRMRGASRVRLYVELGVVGLAAVALWLLARRGLVPSAAAVGVDPLLSATPLLLALAVCVVTLRLYPLPLRGVQRVLRARDGAVGVLGAARAVRDPALGFAAALALVVGVSIVVFSTVFVGTVRAGLEQGARDAVGADLQVRGFALDDDVVDAARAVDGVDEVASVTYLSNVRFDEGADDRGVTLLVADTATLNRIRPDLPALDASEVLVSEDWANSISTSEAELAGRPVTVAGVIPTTALPGVSRQWVLVDAVTAADLDVELPSPERLLIALSPSADPAAVAAELDEVVTATQSANTRALVVVDAAATALCEARSPAIVGVEVALLIAAIVSLLLTVLTVLLASIAAAAARNRLLGVLRILGMSTHQLRGLLAWELGPLALTALAVGTALGLGIAALVASVLDLRPFVGGLAQPTAVIDPIAVLAALLVFLVTVVAAGAISVALGRRLAPAGALKVGDA